MSIRDGVLEGLRDVSYFMAGAGCFETKYCFFAFGALGLRIVLTRWWQS